MARVQTVGKGFEREREDDKESAKHEHGKRDVREDRGEDKQDS